MRGRSSGWRAATRTSGEAMVWTCGSGHRELPAACPGSGDACWIQPRGGRTLGWVICKGRMDVDSAGSGEPLSQEVGACTVESSHRSRHATAF